MPTEGIYFREKPLTHRTHTLTREMIHLLMERKKNGTKPAGEAEAAMLEILVGKDGATGWLKEFFDLSSRLVNGPANASTSGAEEWNWYDGCREDDGKDALPVRTFSTHLGREYHGPVSVHVTPGSISFMGERSNDHHGHNRGQLAVEEIETDVGSFYKLSVLSETIPPGEGSAPAHMVLHQTHSAEILLPAQMDDAHSLFPTTEVVRQMDTRDLVTMKDALIAWGNILPAIVA